MSFSQEVKEEIAEHIPQTRECMIAYLTAIYMQCGRRNSLNEPEPAVRFQSENILPLRMCFTLLKKTFNIYSDICVRQAHATIYILKISGRDALTVMEAMPPDDTDIKKSTGGYDLPECRAFISGAFLCSGSMSDPSRSYHFEIVCASEMNASLLSEMINRFDMASKIVQRKKYHVVYLKEGSQIVDILNVMEAYSALMNMENYRIVKDMRNSVNRRVNCETANISKTVSAAVRQIEDIKYIENSGHMKGLNMSLYEIAELRLANPDMPLKELGQMLDPPVGKSGVNHRLRKLSAIADDLRNKDGGAL